MVILFRIAFGSSLDGAPFVLFFPAVVSAALIGGWGPGMMVIGLSIATVFAIEPPDILADRSRTIPSTVQFAFVSGFDVLLIEGLSRLLAINAVQQARLRNLVAQQETMFREMQHRVGNNMQLVASMLSMTRSRLPPDVGSLPILDEAVARISSLGRLHLKLHDMAFYERGFGAVLKDVLAELFEGLPVDIRVRVQSSSISLDQMTALVMLVVEASTNAAKHVFRPGLGSRFEVQLRTLSTDRLVLLIRDNGPGPSPAPASEGRRLTLGLRIMGEFAQQLRGDLKFKHFGGMVVRLEFPRSSALITVAPAAVGPTHRALAH